MAASCLRVPVACRIPNLLRPCSDLAGPDNTKGLQLSASIFIPYASSKLYQISPFCLKIGIASQSRRLSIPLCYTSYITNTTASNIDGSLPLSPLIWLGSALGFHHQR